MVRIPIIKRGQKHQAHVDRPIVVTGNFTLDYEEVVRRNRMAVIAVFATGLLAFAALVPAAVYRSVADSQRITIEIEAGKITNPSQIMIVNGDVTAGEESYIEFGPIAK